MEKNTGIFIITLILLVGLSGCISSFPDVIIDDSYYNTAPRDSVTFNDVKIIKDIIILNVSYGGGCAEHNFSLVSTSFMESYPVQVNILLSHEDNDDPCDMWITEELSFNLKPLKKSWYNLYNERSGIILINLHNWNEQIIYEF